MKKYLITNFTFYGSSVIENAVDIALKNLGYSMKTSIKGTKYDYTYVLVPINTDIENLELEELVRTKIGPVCKEDWVKSLVSFLMTIDFDLSNVKFTITPQRTISTDEFGIIYTDGSFKKPTKQASYGCCKIRTDKTINENTVLLKDYFSDKLLPFEPISGVVEDGTNNIGELTGLRTAVANFNDSPFQIIISDSEYALKIFREYYHVWKNNGFRTYAGKPIANEQLVKDTYQDIINTGKLVFYKWTKGHEKLTEDDITREFTFNDACDILAKTALGLEDKLKEKEKVLYNSILNEGRSI